VKTRILYNEPYLETMKTIRLFLLILIAQFVFQSCVDDDIPPSGNEGVVFGPHYLNEAKDYIHFKRGTWWVYENSNTGQRDSVAVLSSSLDTITYIGGGNKVIKEQTRYEAYSFRDKYKYLYYLPLSPTPSIYSKSKPYEPNWSYRLSKHKQGDVTGNYIFSYPFEVNELGDMRLDTIYQSYSLRGNEYKDVLVYWIKRDASFPTVDGPNHNGVKARYLYAPNVGIIYKEDLSNNKHWELVKSHIIQ
jgi:hypothetical protein